MTSRIFAVAVLSLLSLAAGHRHLHHAVLSKHAAHQKAAFTPILAFPGLEGEKGEKGAAVSMVAATPTRFEFQRACYQFIYETLQKEPRTRQDPEVLKDAVMPTCVAKDKADCEEWVNKLVSVVDKKEQEEKHSKHHRSREDERSSRRLADEQRAQQHKHVEVEKTQFHHKEKASSKKMRGQAKKEAAPEPKKQPVGGRIFKPKRATPQQEGKDLGTGEVWSPPKAKHHHNGAALLQEEPTRYDVWCDQLYEKSGGVVDKNVEKPSASDSVPRK